MLFLFSSDLTSVLHSKPRSVSLAYDNLNPIKCVKHPFLHVVNGVNKQTIPEFFFLNYCIITSCIVVYLKVMKYQQTYESTLSMSPRSIYHGVKTGTVQEKLFWTGTFYVI